jgi:hypothetical protein
MVSSSDIQSQLFGRIRDQLPEHISLVDEVADILEISNDSAYRRIRGEKAISLYEVQQLAKVYNLSVDDLTGSQFDTVSFKSSFLDGENYSFADWLNTLLRFVIEAGKNDSAEIIFIFNELNIFNIIQFPEICAFKLFFWQKSNLDFTGFKDAQFSTHDLDENILRISEEITDNFLKIDTIEFTTEECLNSMLKQLLYYSEAGYFSTRKDALTLCERLHEFLNHKQKTAELGFKFRYGHEPFGKEGNFRLYHNDIILADNTILVKSGDTCTSFLTTNAINIMHTYNKAFFDYNYRWGMNLLKKSIPISGTAEKERNRFFRILRDKIDKVADRI